MLTTDLCFIKKTPPITDPQTDLEPINFGDVPESVNEPLERGVVACLQLLWIS